MNIEETLGITAMKAAQLLVAATEVKTYKKGRGGGRAVILHIPLLPTRSREWADAYTEFVQSLVQEAVPAMLDKLSHDHGVQLKWPEDSELERLFATVVKLSDQAMRVPNRLTEQMPDLQESYACLWQDLPPAPMCLNLVIEVIYRIEIGTTSIWALMTAMKLHQGKYRLLSTLGAHLCL